MHPWVFPPAADYDRSGNYSTSDGSVFSANWNPTPGVPTGNPVGDFDLDPDGSGRCARADNDDAYALCITYWEDWDGDPVAVRVSGVGNPYFFTGRRLHFLEQTELSGLNPNHQVQESRRRHYLPGQGRWLQRDPAEYVDGMNLYGYVGSRPTRWSDPLGLEPPPTWLPDGGADFWWSHWKFWSEPDVRVGTISVDVESCCEAAGASIVWGVYLDRTGTLRLRYAEESFQYDGRTDEAAKLARREIKARFQELQTRFGQAIGKVVGSSGRQANAGKTNAKLNLGGRIFKYVGRGMWVVGITVDVVAVVEAPDGQRGRVIAKTVGSLAGGWGGGAGGVAAGAKLGALCGAWGGPVGIAVGGVGGAIGGAVVGELVLDTIWEEVENALDSLPKGPCAEDPYCWMRWFNSLGDGAK